MKAKSLVLLLVTALSCNAASVTSAETWSFDRAQTLSGVEASGGVTIDAAQKHSGAGALKLEPGSKVFIPVRSSDGTGKVELWVYEDKATPDSPKKHAAGAMWGLRQSDGHILTVGPVYAPYLSGDTTYAAAAFNPSKEERPWQEVQYLGIRRKEGWHKWTFDFDSEKGLRILFDGKDLNASHERFNWNKSRLDGFTSVVLFGDASDSGQILWVDDLSLTTGPPVKTATRWPPPPPKPPADLTPLAPLAEQSATPYAQWKNGPSQSADYFPIAVWLQEPKDAKLYKAAGINLYVGLWKGPTEAQLDTLREAGMPVICGQNEVGLKHLNDNIIAGWMHGDEPDNAHHIDEYWKNDNDLIAKVWPQYAGRTWNTWGPPIAPSQIVEQCETIRRNDPTRPIMVNLGQGVAWPKYKGRGIRSGAMEDYPKYIAASDIASFDIYPGAHKDIGVKDALWYVPQGVRRLRQWCGDRKIVWNCMECTEISTVGAKPTPEQVKAEVWMSLIHGSRGLIYFVHKFTPPASTRRLLEDREMLAAVTAINRQIHKLARVLNSPTIADGAAVTSSNSNTPVHATIRQYGGASYIFAVAMYGEDTTATFQLRDLQGAATAEVLGEDRTIAVEDGAFTDAFSGSAVHLYKITVRGPGPRTKS